MNIGVYRCNRNALAPQYRTQYFFNGSRLSLVSVSRCDSSIVHCLPVASEELITSTDCQCHVLRRTGTTHGECGAVAYRNVPGHEAHPTSRNRDGGVLGLCGPGRPELAGFARSWLEHVEQ